MKRQLTSIAILTALFGSVSLPAYSAATYGTWSFLKGTPAELFDEADWSLFKETVNGVLEKGEVGTSQSWSNENSTAHGQIEVIKAIKDANHDCKKLKITNQAKDRKRTSTPIFCKQSDGQWKYDAGHKK